MSLPDPPMIWTMLYAFMIIFTFSELSASTINRRWSAWYLQSVLFCFLSYDFYVVSFGKGDTLLTMLMAYAGTLVSGV